MKRYQLLIDIEEGSDEFWEELEKEGKTGCDEVLNIIKQQVEYSLCGLLTDVKLVSFTDK